ncbi:uncharacterized protein LOC132198388 [Neocloeon triangulifer]|uniref:uncharacterized protein LOC132198388 n=1 Tax=Neocloeon triangulifer TaxID=2078957 RepID=UPI00286EE3FE|nr:uncharacterized protein LOC132198388 [Neocloeon triangulifer]
MDNTATKHVTDSAELTNGHEAADTESRTSKAEENGISETQDETTLRKPIAKEGAILSLADRNTNLSAVRRSWSSFTSNLSSSSVAESVHAHRQQFLERRAKFSQGASSEQTPTKKKFEIELKALKLGERRKFLEDDASWQRQRSEKEDAKSQPVYTFRRQGSVREKVQKYAELTAAQQTSPLFHCAEPLDGSGPKSEEPKPDSE